MDAALGAGRLLARGLGTSVGSERKGDLFIEQTVRPWPALACRGHPVWVGFSHPATGENSGS